MLLVNSKKHPTPCGVFPNLMCEHPLSRESVGRHAWAFLHAAAFGSRGVYGPDDVQHKRALIEAYRTNLPCPVCHAHFQRVLAQRPLTQTDLTGRMAFAVDIHNIVNEDLGKPVVSFDDVARFHEVGGNSQCGRAFSTPIMLVLLAFILVMLMTRQRK